MYYINDELKMYNDPKLERLAEVLEEVTTNPSYDVSTSLEDALRPYDLAPELYDLTVASFGNTAGSCDLSRISISQLNRFEHYWETHEEEGDFRPLCGMFSVVESLLETLQQHSTYSMELNCLVERIEQLEDGKVKVVTTSGGNSKTRSIDAAVVTAPPKCWHPRLIPDLPISKQRAINFVESNAILRNTRSRLSDGTKI